MLCWRSSSRARSWIEWTFELPCGGIVGLAWRNDYADATLYDVWRESASRLE